MDRYADSSLVSELIYQLKARDAMRRGLISCRPTDAMRDVRRLLQENSITGLPVIENGLLVGIVSIGDILNTLDHNAIDDPVEKWMTRDVRTVGDDTPLRQAVELFERHRFHRLPVVDAGGRPVGIITPEDLVYRLMVELTRIAEEAERRHQELAARTGLAPTDRKAVQREFAVRAGDYENAGIASSSAKSDLKDRGVDPAVARRAAIALYEAETNIIIHSIGGRIRFEISGGVFRAEAADWGPGIPDLELAMTPGYSTASEFVRTLGFGAGMGLPNIRRCSDRFHIESARNEGTRVTFEVNLGKAEETDEPDGSARAGGAAAHRHDGALPETG